MLTPFAPLRKFAALAAVGILAACANGAELGEQRAELGDFRLCYNIVTTNDVVKGPLSREANIEQFSDNLRSEIDRRFGRYDGDRLYHLAMHMDAYVLAIPGVPLVASPRSALILSVNVWDDALGRPLNEDPEQFTVLESLSGSSVIGSGLTQSAEEQMQTLSQNAAIRIESWLSEHPEWFEHGSETDPSAEGAATPGTEAAEAPETTEPVTPEGLAQPDVAPSEDRCATAGATPPEPAEAG